MPEFGEVSLEGAITRFIAAVFGFFIITQSALNFFRNLGATRALFSDRAALSRLFSKVDSIDDFFTKIVIGLYESRFVAFWILMALIVATISPAATLLEVEDSLRRATCSSESAAAAQLEFCQSNPEAYAAVLGEKLSTNRNHFLQIAIWPTIIFVYGLIFQGIIFLLDPKGELSPNEVISKIPTPYGLLQLLFSLILFVVAHLQDRLGN